MLKIKRVISVLLLLSLLFSTLAGCNSKTENINEAAGSTGGQLMTANQLSANVRASNYNEENFIFDPPLRYIAQNQTLEWDISFP